MNSLLKISVIVPIFNAGKYLKNCIDSIVNQSYKNLEIILIDDGSLDDSLQICKSYAESDKRVKVIHQTNHGLVYTRRVGMRIATGDYIAFVDADDYIEGNAISILIENIAESFPDIVAFGMQEEYINQITIKKNNYESGIYDRKRLESEIFPSMLSYGKFFNYGILPNLVCKLLKRTFLEQSILEVSDIVTFGEDADAVFQLMLQADSVQLIDVNPYRYCKRNGSMTWKELSKSSIEALYCDLQKSFIKSGLYDVMQSQLEDYITFVQLLKNPMSIDSLNTIFHKTENKIALYGAGGFGQAVYGQYTDQICIWADKNYNLYKEKETEVIAPEKLVEQQEEYDLVYIAILNTELCEKIKRSLINQGVKKKILYFKDKECIV